MEVWKDVVGYEGVYQVSSLGRVKSFYYDKVHGRIRKLAHDKDGYLQVGLHQDGKRKAMKIHRLVAEAFLGAAPSPDHEANHKNGIRDDPRPDNLEWVTRSENERHAHRVLGRPGGGAFVTRREVRQIRKLYATGDHTLAELGEMFGVSGSNIGYIVRRDTWKHVP